MLTLASHGGRCFLFYRLPQIVQTYSAITKELPTKTKVIAFKSPLTTPVKLNYSELLYIKAGYCCAPEYF